MTAILAATHRVIVQKPHPVCMHECRCDAATMSVLTIWLVLAVQALQGRDGESTQVKQHSLFCEPFYSWSCLKVILNKENKGLQRRALQRREFPDKERFTSSLFPQAEPNQFITTSCCRLLWSKQSAQYKG